MSIALGPGCSSAPEALQSPGEAEVTTSPALPTEPAPVDEAPLPPASLTPSPTCAAPGSRVVLRLGWTSDHRVPECMRVDDFEVTFGAKKARITMVGPTSDGYCALDVLVPAKASSAVVTVTIGRDVFESQTAFGVPCP